MTDPKALIAASRILHLMTPDQVIALADALEGLMIRQDGERARGGGAIEQGSVTLSVKGGRVRYLETRTSQDIGRLDAEVAPAARAGRV